jgi:hypothetical protein
VSNGDYSFTAKHDGKFVYCFGNQHWGSNTKEVSFNVHGVVYVPETQMPSDPLEAEGAFSCPKSYRGCSHHPFVPGFLANICACLVQI